jgi:tellurite resistance protein TerC
VPLDTIGSPLLWGGFIAFVLAMLALDLGVFHRKAHEVSLTEAGAWSAVWVGLSGVFALGVHHWFGADRALEFTTAYFLEKALAVDNIFVFVIVFAAFGIPARSQHRVLVWGVLGALVMRAAFIVVGGALVQSFHWMTYVFGAVLLLTGLKLLLRKEQPFQPGQSLVVRAFQKVLPVTPELVGDHFLVTRDGRRWATPLLLALVAVEAADLVFAVDSIPAVFAVTTDPFIVFTSNLFAMLGLRSMYFLLARVIARFTHLKTGLAVVLVFVGAKMALVDVLAIPVGVSLAVIAAILGASIGASFLLPRKPGPAPVAVPSPEA